MRSALNVGNSANPYAVLDKQTVIGALKATGSRDPDVLHTTKVQLYGWLTFARLLPVPVMGFGALLLMMGSVGTVFGILFLLFGWWAWRRASTNIRTIERGYAEYLGALETSR